jgi:DNA-directed RNA polymerase alpha subunit
MRTETLADHCPVCYRVDGMGHFPGCSAEKREEFYKSRISELEWEVESLKGLNTATVDTEGILASMTELRKDLNDLTQFIDRFKQTLTNQFI